MFRAIIVAAMLGFVGMLLLGVYGMTAASLGRRAAGRALVRLGVIVLVAALVLFALRAILPPAWQVYFWPGLELLVSAWAWGVILWRTLRRGQTGIVLLRVDHTDAYHLSLLFGAAIVALALYLAVEALIGATFDLEAAADALFYLTVGALALRGASKEFLFTERGIALGSGVIQWRQVQAYRWESGRRNTLTLVVGGRLRLFRTVSLPIPVEQKEAVDKILAEKAPAAA